MIKVWIREVPVFYGMFWRADEPAVALQCGTLPVSATCPRERPHSHYGVNSYIPLIFFPLKRPYHRLFEIGKRGKWGGHNHGLKNLDIMSKYRILEVVDTFQTYCKPINLQQHKTTAFCSFQTLHYASHKHLNGICFPLRILLQEQTKQIKHEMGHPTPYASIWHPLPALLITRQNHKDGLGLTGSNHCS